MVSHNYSSSEYEYLVTQPQYSSRLLKSSCLTALSAFSAAKKDLWSCSLVATLVLLTSINYWRHPTMGWRRNMDMLAVAGGLLYHMYLSLSCEVQFYQYLYYALMAKSVFCYFKSITCPNKSISYLWHIGMHAVGNLGTLALYVGLARSLEG
ncbi:hypothetical protein SPRG_18167 [Saprolegnia parasitica CBS 223.65]|uniref:Uncharacterized protein n=1 Tax=Saprolegnia parasitica (strain CBS 223.65) TaxID=695850 RepID=A0A067BNM9_SAPPC|nr:hypothetical protein SPRG_18167 [Saprolegnia parasitica CBS 223.65]KDO16297.1 hypothetical protein SPRG_18167 [Saprolegnia parasitica CBS 223.65]|eukprot:XP_012212995.1 hypothetical protein SPRG_18167 [Saprolegnia parasitica CBS 223.65]